jgi:hypothetical protein
MLADRLDGRTRLQCKSCGAHALVDDEDYKHLLASREGLMRCEVCGSRAHFNPTAPRQPEASELAIH